MNELALFAGAGGGILGGHLLGWRTVCAVEWEPHPASVLVARQNCVILPAFPIGDDVQTFDGRPWRGIVDVVSGGFPCQDISAAGKGAGIDGERSGMWSHMARIIGEVRPRYVFVENSPVLTSRGLHRVLGDLASLGFDARWGVVSAADVGAPHQRDRIWIVGDSSRKRRSKGRDDYGQNDGSKLATNGQHASQMADANSSGCKTQRICGVWPGQSRQTIVCGGEMADTASQRQQTEGNCQQYRSSHGIEKADQLGSSGEILAHANIAQRKRGSVSSRIYSQYSDSFCSSWWNAEPELGRVANGVAARVDRLKAIGNGQVSLVAATAWRLLNDPA